MPWSACAAEPDEARLRPCVRDVARRAEVRELFGGDDPRIGDESRFLAALRDHADACAAAGRPSSTTVLTALVPLRVRVDVPGLPADCVNVAPPAISIEARGRWVSTNVGVRNGGSCPHPRVRSRTG